MAQRRPDRVHGVVVVDKPAGLSSQDTVTRVRKRIGVRSAGHTGTLDPGATGVLPICLGQATKIAQWLLADDKHYTCELELGLVSDTHDLEGTVTRRTTVGAIDPAALEAALAALRGDTLQVPPMHSAIFHQGLRLHELARAGVEVERAPRPIRVDRLEVLGIAAPRLSLAVSCTKGTYVRALVRDLGERLGTGAVLTALRRTASGRFTLADALPVDALDNRTIAAHLVPTATVLGLPAVTVPDDRVDDVLNGHAVRTAHYAAPFAEGDRFQLVTTAGATLAVCERRADRTYFHRVLTYAPA